MIATRYPATPMIFTPTRTPEVLLIEPIRFGDERGFFKELYQDEHYQAAGIELPFVQDNLSRSRRGTLRGLHYQLPFAQGKLLSVVDGEVFDVAVDIRKGSPRFGHWVGERLTAENHRQLYVPPGFAHGFCVLSETADVLYKCTERYHPEAEQGLLWSDPELGIEWPGEDEPLLSDKDAVQPRLRDIPKNDLPNV